MKEQNIIHQSDIRDCCHRITNKDIDNAVNQMLDENAKASKSVAITDYVTIPRQLLEALAENTDELIEILNGKRMKTEAYTEELKQARAILDT